jgi:hypothetical protein
MMESSVKKRQGNYVQSAKSQLWKHPAAFPQQSNSSMIFAFYIPEK